MRNNSTPGAKRHHLIVNFIWLWLLSTVAACAWTRWNWPEAHRSVYVAYCEAKALVWLGAGDSQVFFAQAAVKAIALAEAGDRWAPAREAAHQIFVLAPLSGLVAAIGLAALFFIITRKEQ